MKESTSPNFDSVANRRDDFPAIRRHLIDHRNIEIAVNGHGQRARNRRRRHDQNIRRRFARRQPGPLRHAELVLLIDDGEAEILERNTLVKQRMRPDDDIRASSSPETERKKAFFLSRRPSGAKLDSERLEPAAEDGVMLLGQDLGGRHERGLEAGFHREQHRRDRDDGLAGTDIALQQAVHRLRRRKIAPQFVDHARLRIRQIERQTAQESSRATRPGPQCACPLRNAAAERRDAISICIAKNSEKTRCSRAGVALRFALLGK